MIKDIPLLFARRDLKMQPPENEKMGNPDSIGIGWNGPSPSSLRVRFENGASLAKRKLSSRSNPTLALGD